MDALWLIEIGIGALGASPLIIAPLMDAWESLTPRFIPQCFIDDLARDCAARFGARARDELVTRAGRARLRGETAEEQVAVRVMAALDRIECDA